MTVPDYTDPLIIISLLIVGVYAYIGGKWLDRRYKANAKKIEKQNQEKRMEDFK